MNTHENIVVISAELKGLDYYANFDRTTELRTKLLQLGLSFFGVTQHSDNTSQYSFCVLTKNLGLMVELAQMFGQNSILHSDSQRQTSIHKFSDNSEQMLGKLKAVQKDVALNQKEYIIVKEEGKELYYTVL